MKKPRKYLDIIFKGLYTLFIAVLVGIVLLLVFSRFPLAGNYQIYVVQSGSMAPAIKIGAVVVVKPAATYQVGDIITFSGNNIGIPTTHRIVAVNNSGSRTNYTTKGDANDNQDPNPVAAGRVLGKVLINIPYVGYAVAAAKQPLGFLIIIVAPALLIIYDEVIKIINELKARRVKSDK